MIIVLCPCIEAMQLESTSIYPVDDEALTNYGSLAIAGQLASAEACVQNWNLHTGVLSATAARGHVRYTGPFCPLCLRGDVSWKLEAASAYL